MHISRQKSITSRSIKNTGALIVKKVWPRFPSVTVYKDYANIYHNCISIGIFNHFWQNSDLLAPKNCKALFLEGTSLLETGHNGWKSVTFTCCGKLWYCILIFKKIFTTTLPCYSKISIFHREECVLLMWVGYRYYKKLFLWKLLGQPSSKISGSVVYPT